MRFTLKEPLAKLDSCIGNLFAGFGEVGTLFASDIMLNGKAGKMHTFAKSGEQMAVAYYKPSLMQHFTRLVSRVILEGRDLPYQSQLCANEALRGDVITVTYNNPTTTLELQHMNGTEFLGAFDWLEFEEMKYQVRLYVDAMRPKAVIIDNLSVYAEGNDINHIVGELNNLASETDTLVLSGWEIAEYVPALLQIADYFNRYDRNLCVLNEEEARFNDKGEERVINYFSIYYGSHEAKQIVYSADSEGNIYIPEKLTKYLRMKETLPLIGGKSISKNAMKHRIFGALLGEFEFKGMDGRISEMYEWGMLQKHGKGTKTVVSLADSTSTDKLYNGNIALLGMTDPYYREQKKKIVPFMRIGDFKLIASYESGDDYIVATKHLMLALLRCIITGKKMLNFSVKTPYRNILVLHIGDTSNTDLFREEHINTLRNDAGFTSQCDVVNIPTSTNDSDFVDHVNNNIEKYNPDFVFIFNLDSLELKYRDANQLAKELQEISKRKQIACIAQTALRDIENSSTIYDAFEDLEYGRKDFVNKYVYGVIPKIYNFWTESEGKYLSTRFHIEQNQPCLTPASTLKRAYLINKFMYANDMKATELQDEHYNITNKDISTAKKLGIIKVYGKGDARVIKTMHTFKDE